MDWIADMISMRALECLVTIVEQGSLTKAAAALHMSQPALSHQIAAIERELGTPVVERLPRGIRPTAAGLAAVAEARVALAAADRAIMAGRRVAAGTGGRIRIACAETMTAWVLVPVLRSWRRRFPDVELDLKEYTSADRMLDVIVAAPHDDLLRRFVGDLKQRGLPDSRMPRLSQPGTWSGTAGAAVRPGDARPVGTDGKRAP
jgi:DNA-binding transcriptional LysR family regulator